MPPPRPACIHFLEAGHRSGTCVVFTAPPAAVRPLPCTCTLQPGLPRNRTILPVSHPETTPVVSSRRPFRRTQQQRCSLYPVSARIRKTGSEIVIGDPCHREEPSPDMPEEFLLEFPACLAVHSPPWWRQHFEKTGLAAVALSSRHGRGWEFWEDRVTYPLEKQPPEEMNSSRREMVHQMIRMLNRDVDEFVSHFMLQGCSPVVRDFGTDHPTLLPRDVSGTSNCVRELEFDRWCSHRLPRSMTIRSLDLDERNGSEWTRVRRWGGTA